MGILSRFKDIMSANINAALDGLEDPSKMVDETLRKLNENLAEVKKETAGVIANETRDKRLVDKCKSDIEKMTTAAQNALKAGNEDDAKTLIGRKQRLEADLVSLNANYATSKKMVDQMRQMHDKLVSDINALDGRRAAIKAKMADAKALEKINDIQNSAASGTESIEAFNRLEAKADQMLDEANAKATLNGVPDETDDLADKYVGGGNAASVDDELAKMKEQLGL